MGPRLLAEGFGEATHQVLEDVAAVDRSHLVRTEIALVCVKLPDDQVQAVGFHQTLDHTVHIELGEDVLHIGAEPTEEVAEVRLNVLGVGEECREGELARVVELIAGGTGQECVYLGQMLDLLVFGHDLFMCGQEAVVQALDDGERKNDRAIFVRLVRAAEDVRDVPDDRRFLGNIDADGLNSIVCHNVLVQFRCYHSAT